MEKRTNHKIAMMEELRKMQKRAPRKHKTTLDLNNETNEIYHSGFVIYVPKMQVYVREFIRKLKEKRLNAIEQDQPPALAVETEPRAETNYEFERDAEAPTARGPTPELSL